jgi:hypothetical protein
VTTPNYSFVLSAQLVGATTMAVGNVMITSSSEPTKYVKATTANRGTRRAEGIALTAWDDDTRTGSVRMQSAGTLDAETSLLGTGSASWVRCSATGTIERCTPAAGDDIIGYAEADGRVHLAFGMWTAAIINGGSGTFTPPTGTGFATTTGGALDAASLPFPLPVAKGGTNRTALGTGLQVLRTNSGATDTEWATIGTFTAPTGTGFVTVTSGALDPAAATSFNVSTYTLTDTSIAQYDMLLADATPRFKRFAKGSNSRALVTSSGGVVQWAQIDLTAMVTGVLPSANAPSHTGDVTGAHSATVVAKVNGATVPAAGALTTGNSLHVSGASALSYSALNLAGGSGWVTGTLPVGNGGTGLASPGTSGNVLTSNGTGWVSSAPAGGSPGGSLYTVQFNDTTFDGADKLRMDSGTAATANPIATDLRLGGRPQTRAGEEAYEPEVDEDGTITHVTTTTGPTYAWDQFNSGGDKPKYDRRTFYGGASSTNVRSTGTVLAVTGVPPGLVHMTGFVPLGRDESHPGIENDGAVYKADKLIYLDSGGGYNAIYDIGGVFGTSDVGSEVSFTPTFTWDGVSAWNFALTYVDNGHLNLSLGTYGEIEGSIRIAGDLTFRRMTSAASQTGPNVIVPPP